jgi:anti-sigma factor RsiW
MIIPTCRELIEFLDDYVDRRLPIGKRLAFEVHLAGCRDCREYLRSYRQTVVLAKESGEEADRGEGPMPEQMVQAILKAMREGDAEEGKG